MDQKQTQMGHFIYMNNSVISRKLIQARHHSSKRCPKFLEGKDIQKKANIQIHANPHPLEMSTLTAREQGLRTRGQAVES